ncbi:hypothetical protein GLOTRDRAFT_97190, partial [Gloeophyllum trabeum ATCC 11539]
FLCEIGHIPKAVHGLKTPRSSANLADTARRVMIIRFHNPDLVSSENVMFAHCKSLEITYSSSGSTLLLSSTTASEDYTEFVEHGTMVLPWYMSNKTIIGNYNNPTARRSVHAQESAHKSRVLPTKFVHIYQEIELTPSRTRGACLFMRYMSVLSGHVHSGGVALAVRQSSLSESAMARSLYLITHGQGGEFQQAHPRGLVGGPVEDRRLRMPSVQSDILRRRRQPRHSARSCSYSYCLGRAEELFGDLPDVMVKSLFLSDKAHSVRAVSSRAVTSYLPQANSENVPVAVSGDRDEVGFVRPSVGRILQVSTALGASRAMVPTGCRRHTVSPLSLIGVSRSPHLEYNLRRSNSYIRGAEIRLPAPADVGFRDFQNYNADPGVAQAIRFRISNRGNINRNECTSSSKRFGLNLANDHTVWTDLGEFDCRHQGEESDVAVKALADRIFARYCKIFAKTCTDSRAKETMTLPGKPTSSEDVWKKGQRNKNEKRQKEKKRPDDSKRSRPSGCFIGPSTKSGSANLRTGCDCGGTLSGGPAIRSTLLLIESGDEVDILDFRFRCRGAFWMAQTKAHRRAYHNQHEGLSDQVACPYAARLKVAGMESLNPYDNISARNHTEFIGRISSTLTWSICCLSGRTSTVSTNLDQARRYGTGRTPRVQVASGYQQLDWHLRKRVRASVWV